MAVFVGREKLVQGFWEAELEVGDVLCRILPDDTYIIAQPNIGEKLPDFLVISPTYGFRIIEVKNLTISSIEDVFSNGLLQTKYGNKNPFAQVKSYAVAWKNYLLSNHRNMGLDDPFRNIGYVVIHKGFSKLEFEYKFGRQIHTWATGDADNYYKYHFCFDELDSSFNELLAEATRFRSYSNSLKNYQIKEIVEHLKISPSKQTDDPALYNEQNKITDKGAEHQPKKSSRKKWLVNLILIALIIISIFSVIKFSGYIHVGSKSSSTGSISSLIENEEQTEAIIEITATVERFFYDSDNDTKFITLTDHTGNMEAVIFSDVDVPIIEEGETYIFKGYIQPSEDEEKMELNVTDVDEPNQKNSDD
ncbi:hypothetical protein GMD78_12895 [Ornithinibacillus sp. L9]|uniref:NERD domain-containing protein n=1 Tax=Ornithinibacillus caprae TaxID=2678566 RepID=A0A6N8FJ53_9BACI|nr:NERD domain-containing protein [Ornithinibacillus caprae]MUK89271.1 hypothetical protein [Ornithinibacillus caprae]